MYSGQFAGFSHVPYRVVYYDIVGSTKEDLDAQLSALCPIDQKGNKHWALTEWKTIPRWYQFGTSNVGSSCCGTCLIDILVTLPNWKHLDDASIELVNRWEQFIQGLMQHEMGHVKIIEENYPLIVNALQIMELTNDNSKMIVVNKLVDRLNNEYDEKTDHGRKQLMQCFRTDYNR